MFDHQAFHTITGGDHDTAREIAELFRKDSLSLLESLQQAVDHGDEEVTRRLGHTLKSTCATIGALQASAWALGIEREGISAARIWLPRLQEHMPEVFTYLDRAVGELPVG